MNAIRSSLRRYIHKLSKRVYSTCNNSNGGQKNSTSQIDATVKTTTLKDGPPLEYFIANDAALKTAEVTVEEKSVPYLDNKHLTGNGRKVYFETYGCQMNVNDTEIAWAILQKNGFEKTNNIKESDVILVMTCAIREGAEQKIWRRLQYYKDTKRHLYKTRNKDVKIGILGCMAERLKKQILEKEKMVDIVCGPDAYRDLPHMLAVTESGQTAVNVVLSLEETYADVVPVRLNANSTTAFVSIMRGCDNMCSYCIVPFTRGRERSRPIDSIIEEVKALSDMGIRQVTLLGQNVNSYRDLSQLDHHMISTPTSMAKGFNTVYRNKLGGRRFADLLEKVSEVDPEMRVRFTSPHPKDFPDEVLHLIKERPNICNQIHVPAQSGSTEMLTAMRRGYTREAYIELVHHIREILPDVTLSSDFIAGFCGETEKDHQESLTLLRQIKYDVAYCFPYSMRQKTRAFHKLEDDVPDDVKSRRHMELVSAFREEAQMLHEAQHGQRQLVLVEGTSKKSEKDLFGRNDANTKVIFPLKDLPLSDNTEESRSPKPGDYVLVEISGSNSEVLKGKALYHTTLQGQGSKSVQQQSVSYG